MHKLSPVAALCAFLAAAAGVHAQSSCSSDGQAQPVALLERFINADCDACWGDAKSAVPGRGELALDWIAPGGRGEDAPLSAAATRDANARLEALRRRRPAQADAVLTKALRPERRLRVAHGLAFNGYIGTSIELSPGSGGPWRAWLLLVETIPAGTEGSPVERNLVRNVLQPAWGGDRPLSKGERAVLRESRPLSIPEGAKPERLRVVGWVEDHEGRLRAVAQSRCVP
jgi:hypothetical protein